jgi:hypothetical protein
MRGFRTLPCHGTLAQTTRTKMRLRHRWSISGLCQVCGKWKQDVVLPEVETQPRQRAKRQDELI